MLDSDMAIALEGSDTQQIAVSLRRRDVTFLQSLVEQYQYRLVRYLVYLTGHRDGVDDLVQEIWLRVLERGASYDGRSRFEPWLFTIARNLAIDHMRKHRAVSLDTGNNSDDEESKTKRHPDLHGRFTLRSRGPLPGRPSVLPKPCRVSNPSTAKCWYFAFRKNCRCRKLRPSSTPRSRPCLPASTARSLPCAHIWKDLPMKPDIHPVFRTMIDQALIADAAMPQPAAPQPAELRTHLQSCESCRRYLNMNARVISSLGSYSFAIDPSHNAVVYAALQRAAQQPGLATSRNSAHLGTNAHAFNRRQFAWACVLAVLFTAAGSFLDMQSGPLLASLLPLHAAAAKEGLRVFWLTGSFGALLLFPLLPFLSQSLSSRPPLTPP